MSPSFSSPPPSLGALPPRIISRYDAFPTCFSPPSIGTPPIDNASCSPTYPTVLFNIIECTIGPFLIYKRICIHLGYLSEIRLVIHPGTGRVSRDILFRLSLMPLAPDWSPGRISGTPNAQQGMVCDYALSHCLTIGIFCTLVLNFKEKKSP